MRCCTAARRVHQDFLLVSCDPTPVAEAVARRASAVTRLRRFIFARRRKLEYLCCKRQLVARFIPTQIHWLAVLRALSPKVPKQFRCRRWLSQTQSALRRPAPITLAQK